MLNKEIIARYEGLIFDMDGTVIDTMPCHKQAWELVGAEMGYALDGDVMYQLGELRKNYCQSHNGKSTNAVIFNGRCD